MVLSHPHLASPWQGEGPRSGWGAIAPETPTLLLPLPKGGRVGAWASHGEHP